MFEKLGDKKASLLMDSVMEAVDRCAQRHGGQALKRTGDELLCVFATPEEAALASKDTHGAVEASPGGICRGENRP
jgi:class 3 adenylate cyclase